MLNTSFSPWPSFTQEEAESISRVLLSNKVNYWTGSECREFEKEYAEYIGSKHAIALANGTVALDLALKGLGIESGDEIIVTSRTFLASVSSIVNASAIPVFVDVSPNSQNITSDSIEQAITSKTRAIVCVHLAGWPCDMGPIMSLAEQYNLYVIEDCAQAHGAFYRGRAVGSIGHVGTWSFCQDKIMSTGGEGGMVTTNDSKLWSNMWSYKDHGKSWNAVYERDHPPGFRWLHETFGTNWRMTELQAAIGRIQLARMPEWHENRLKYAHQIWNTAADCDAIRVPSLPDYIEHAAYKCYVFVENGMRDEYMAEIISRGVPCFSGSCSEVYLEKAFDNTNFRPKERLPVAKKLGETSLMFLCHPTLTQDEIDLTCDVIKEVCC